MPGENPNLVLPRKECLVPVSLRTPPGNPPFLWFRCGAQPCESSGAALQIVLQTKGCLPATGDAGIQRAATEQTECLDMAAGGIHFTYVHVPMHLHLVLLRGTGKGVGAACACTGAPNVCVVCAAGDEDSGVMGVLCVSLPAGNTPLPPCWLDSGIWLSYHILKGPL